MKIPFIVVGLIIVLCFLVLPGFQRFLQKQRMLRLQDALRENVLTILEKADAIAVYTAESIRERHYTSDEIGFNRIKIERTIPPEQIKAVANEIRTALMAGAKEPPFYAFDNWCEPPYVVRIRTPKDQIDLLQCFKHDTAQVYEKGTLKGNLKYHGSLVSSSGQAAAK